MSRDRVEEKPTAPERSISLSTRLLGALAEGGIHPIANLARRLDVSEELVRALAEELARRGYLQAAGDDCGAGCRGCALSAGCAPGEGPAVPLFALTAKGRRAAG
jgi:hypothetical protein